LTSPQSAVADSPKKDSTSLKGTELETLRSTAGFDKEGPKE